MSLKVQVKRRGQLMVSLVRLTDSVAEPYLEVDTEDLLFGPEGGSVTFPVEANTEWSAE